jgi:hypothetical protein
MIQQVKINIDNHNHNHKTLKESFLEIMENPLFLETSMRYEKDKIRYLLDKLFRYFDISEFQYKLEFIDDKLEFLPIREIDKLILKGILAENIRKEKFKRILEY